MTSYTAKVLDEVRAQLAPDDTVLKEARNRRELVTSAALTFAGALRTFQSGSLAHGTANCPIHERDKGLDADCGVVLDRRSHPSLGPDGSGVGPNNVVQQVLTHIMPAIHKEYPSATLKTTKRAIFVEFHSPLATTEDPTVDLIVALTRASELGLWIPNMEANDWDASDPQKHTDLFTSGRRDLRQVRARVVRLAKAENKRTPLPPLCSFNIETLGWMFIEDGMSEPEALRQLWRKGAADLRNRLTPDPAGVSAPIKVDDRDEAVRRLEHAADCLDAALAIDWHEGNVRAQLHELWPEFVADQAGGTSKARLAAALKNQSHLGVASTGLLTTTPAESLSSVKHTRSYGD
jgi:hypothetical protein